MESIASRKIAAGGETVKVWTRGDARLMARLSEAVVVTGARDCTAYGAEVAAEFAADLASAGHLVMNGGAFGIDGSAVRGSLAAGGTPVVVLPCGIDMAYPRAHAALFERVVETGGLILSLTAPGEAPLKARFMDRNYWMGEVAAATVIVEANRRSGSLVVARSAMAAGRRIGAAPGSIHSQQSSGTHDMIAAGVARLIHDSASLLRLASGEEA